MLGVECLSNGLISSVELGELLPLKLIDHAVRSVGILLRTVYMMNYSR